MPFEQKSAPGLIGTGRISEVGPLTRGVVWFPVVSGADLLDQRLVVQPVKGHGAVDQRIQ